mgnify:FL=1
MAKFFFQKLPNAIQVDVRKGKSGALLAHLPKYETFTEADDLNELFLQVNDLIYAYFDVPKKYQDKIYYIPSRGVQEDLVRIAAQRNNKIFSEFNVTPHYDISLVENLKHIKHLG